MIDPQVAYDKLCSFQTAKELREFFQGENVKGCIGTGDMCPIANWLTDTTGLKTSVATEITFWTEGRMKHFKHTWATTVFIDQFDDGLYRELIGNPEELRND